MKRSTAIAGINISNALTNVKIERLDAELLLASILSKDRTWLMAHADKSLTQAQKSMFDSLCARRREKEPLAYITGEKEFYGRLFNVNPSVLIPRPSTEGLIDLALDFLKTKNGKIREVDNGIVCISKYLNKCSNIKTIVDVGTGSGCIAITLALELPDIKVIATDISKEALKVAKKNAEFHGVNNKIEFRFGNSLEPLSDINEPFIIISNPPYIPDGEKLQLEVQCEPKEALFAGQNGMDIIKPLIDAARKHPLCNGIVIECRKEQVSSLLD